MKVIFDSTTGQIYRAYADDNFDCPLGPNEVEYVFDNSKDPSDQKVDLSSAPNYVMINQDTAKLIAMSGSISGQSATNEGSFDIPVNETVNLTIQKINGASSAELTSADDNENVFIVSDDPNRALLATLDVEQGDLFNGTLNIQLTAPATPGSEQISIHGDGLKAVLITLNYI